MSEIILHSLEDLNFNPDEPFHFFTSSAGNWNTGENLLKVLNKQKRADNGAGVYKFSRCSLWIVPGDKSINYKINNYAPQVHGAIFLMMVDYK